MYYDHRDIAANKYKWYESFDKHHMIIRFRVVNDEDDEEYLIEILGKEVYKKLADEDGCVSFPAKFEVCPTCNGKGSYVNPSIDAHGITGDEWAEWDYEERERYLNGHYNITCCECNGTNVVPEIKEDFLSEDQKKLLEFVNEAKRSEIDYARMILSEIQMGC